MKKIAYIVILFCLTTLVKGQTTNVTLQEFPKKWQLYPRDSSNNAITPISGSITENAYEAISLLIIKEDNPKNSFFYKKQLLINDSKKNATFNFQPQIKAGLIEYDFALYAHQGKDSILIKNAEKITSGDVVLFYGQSNAAGFSDVQNYKVENEFARTIYGSGDNFFWYYSELGTETKMGTFASEFAKQIKEKYQMPICIINGAIGSKSIIDLSDRDANNPANTATNYGKFLDAVNLAKVTKSAKILIWRQGEYEAENEYLANLYPDNFKKLYQYLLTDFPNLKKMYVFQNNIYGTVSNNAGQLRDFQRKNATIYPIIETFATIGTKTFDGLHYLTAGYLQSATELAGVVGRDFYKEQTIQNLSSPAIQKCILSEDKKKITLVFDKNQTLVSPRDSSTFSNGIRSVWKLKNYFYLGKNNAQIDTILVNQNRAILQLKDVATAETLTYLPSYLGYYDGVLMLENIALKNALGRRALTFDNFPIANALIVSSLKATLNVATNTVTIESQIQPVKNSVIYLEKSKDKNDNFVVIATVSQGESPFANYTYFDRNLVADTQYFYRIKMENAVSESDYSAIQMIKTPAIVVNKPLIINSFKAILTTNNEAKVDWQLNSTEKSVFYLERAKDKAENFTLLTTLSNGETSYLDKNLLADNYYFYRLKAKSATAESAYSEVQAIKTPAIITGIYPINETELVKLYPNPVENGKFFSEIKIAYTSLIIKDLNGKIIHQIENNLAPKQLINVENLPAGVYLLEIITKENNKITKKLIIP